MYVSLEIECRGKNNKNITLEKISQCIAFLLNIIYYVFNSNLYSVFDITLQNTLSDSFTHCYFPQEHVQLLLACTSVLAFHMTATIQVCPTTIVSLLINTHVVPVVKNYLMKKVEQRT